MIRLILRSGSSLTSQELASTSVVAQINQPSPTPTPAPTPTVISYGLGCSDFNCIWLRGPNLAAGMVIDLRSVSNGQILKGNISTVFTQKIPTETALTFSIPVETRELFKSQGFNIYVVDPKNGTWSKPLFYKRP